MEIVIRSPCLACLSFYDPSMNAFATGSNPQNAAVAVGATTGLLAVMNREELEGVIGCFVKTFAIANQCISTIAVMPLLFFINDPKKNPAFK